MESSMDSDMESEMEEAICPAQYYSLTDVLEAAPLLAQMHERLGSDTASYTSQAQSLLSTACCLRVSYHGSERPLLKHLLLQSDTQLLQIAAGCMQQLAVQLANPMANMYTFEAAAQFWEAMPSVLQCVATPKLFDTTPSSTSDTQVLGLLQSTGEILPYSFTGSSK